LSVSLKQSQPKRAEDIHDAFIFQEVLSKMF
jgi:hypothetical protein